MPKIFKKQASMRTGKVSDFEHILSMNKNFQVISNTFALALLPPKLFQLFGWFLLQLLLTPGRDIRLCTTSIECYVTDYVVEGEHKLHFQRKRCKTTLTFTFAVRRETGEAPMSTRGPKNRQQVLERGHNLCYWTLQYTFA